MGWLTCGAKIRGINLHKEDENEKNDETLDYEQNNEAKEESDDNAKFCDDNNCGGNCGNWQYTNDNDRTFG